MQRNRRAFMTSQDKLIIGCGYLGRLVARLWLEQGHRVWGLVRSASRAREIEALGVRPLLGDLLAREPLPVFPKVAAVLFAVARGRGSAVSAADLQAGGVERTLNNLPGFHGRFVYISSTSVYGQDAGEWVDELSACQPVTDGGQACLEAERRARALLPSVNVLRLAGLYGPGRLLARTTALHNGMPIEGRPDGWLNLIHVEDAARAVLAAEDFADRGTTYIVCDDRPTRRLHYHEQLARLIGAPPPIFSAPDRCTPNGAGVNKRLSNRKIKSELALQLAYPTIEQGLPAALGLA